MASDSAASDDSWGLSPAPGPPPAPSGSDSPGPGAGDEGGDEAGDEAAAGDEVAAGDEAGGEAGEEAGDEAGRGGGAGGEGEAEGAAEGEGAAGAGGAAGGAGGAPVAGLSEPVSNLHTCGVSLEGPPTSTRRAIGVLRPARAAGGAVVAVQCNFGGAVAAGYEAAAAVPPAKRRAAAAPRVEGFAGGRHAGRFFNSAFQFKVTLDGDAAVYDCRYFPTKGCLQLPGRAPDGAACERVADVVAAYLSAAAPALAAAAPVDAEADWAGPLAGAAGAPAGPPAFARTGPAVTNMRNFRLAVVPPAGARLRKRCVSLRTLAERLAADPRVGDVARNAKQVTFKLAAPAGAPRPAVNVFSSGTVTVLGGKAAADADAGRAVLADHLNAPGVLLWE